MHVQKLAAGAASTAWPALPHGPIQSTPAHATRIIMQHVTQAFDVQDATYTAVLLHRFGLDILHLGNTA